MSTRHNPPRKRRARVAPRPRGGRGSRIRWDRLGRIVLVLVLFAVVAMYARPVMSVADSWNDTKAEDRRLAEVQRENRRLAKRHEELTGGPEKTTGADKPAGNAEVPTGTDIGATTVSDATIGSDGTDVVSDPSVPIDPDPASVEPEPESVAEPVADTPPSEPEPVDAGPPAGGGGNTGAVAP